MNIQQFIKRYPKRVGIFCVLAAAIVGIGVAVQMNRSMPRAVEPQNVYGVPVYTQFIGEESPGRPGMQRKIQYIVIHETGNKRIGADAASHSIYLHSGKSGTTSWHYTVDDHEVFHHVPDDEVAWHAGDKLTQNGGNASGVGIELCVNQDGNFEQTMDNGAKLTAYLLRAYHLPLKAVKQHADFSKKNCPETLRNTDHWGEFLNRVSDYQSNNET